MTTIIIHEGKMYGDRRKLVNYPEVGILGASEECKLYTTPYCHYATAGFDPTPKQRLYIEQLLCIITSIDYMLFNPEFQKSPLGIFLKKFKGFYSLLNSADYIAHWSFENTNIILGKVMAVNRWNIFTSDGALLDNAQTAVIGGCSKTAYTLLHNDVSIGDVYKAMRSHGAPTGDQFDSVAIADLDKTLLPPICDEDFIAIFMVLAKKYYAANKEERDTEARLDKFSKLLCIFNELGRFDRKKNKLIIYKNAEKNIRKKCLGEPGPERLKFLKFVKGEA